MSRRWFTREILISILMIFFAIFARSSVAETFSFGFEANSVNDQPTPSTSISAGAFVMTLSAGPSGAILRETATQAGLGVSSAPLGAGIDPGGLSGINVLQGALLGTSEFVEFSFDRSGILTGLNFDGISDERFEFFVLETAGGLRVNFVDSRANNPNTPNPSFPTPVNTAITDGAIEGEIVYLLEINSTIDDEVQNLAIPFVAGQVFTLTYDFLGDVYGQGPGNGSTLQGITVREVPEPAAAALILLGGLVAMFAQSRTNCRTFERQLREATSR
jgi:hypothetical protein